MPRPLIGLTTYAEETRFGRQDTFAAVLPLSYVHAVRASGGQPILITPDDPDPELVTGLSGIVFTGGSDVDPSLYGEAPHLTTQVRPVRDRSELLLMRAAIRAGLPTLGICRGMQLMAVAYGGHLHQHLPELLGHHGHRPTKGLTYGKHEVTLLPDSVAHAVLGGKVTVNSFHHQGVVEPGGLRVTGRCPRDGLIEAVEDPALPFVVGVQWHPEEDRSDRRLFDALVAAASVPAAGAHVPATPAGHAPVPSTRDAPRRDRRAAA